MGPLDEIHLLEAWKTLVNRHGALRTCFVWEKLQEPMQVVRQSSTLDFESVDISTLAEAQQSDYLSNRQQQEEQHQFDLRKAPLIRLKLFKLANQKYQFWLTRHHLVMDGWSHNQLFSELKTLYSQPLMAGQNSPKSSFKPYIEWLARQNNSELEHYWRQELENFSHPSFIATKTTRKSLPDRYVNQSTPLSVPFSQKIAKLAMASGVSEAVVFQAAVAISLANHCRMRDVAFGLTVTGRPPGLDGVESSIGTFINNVPVRIRFDAQQSMSKWLSGIQHNQHVRLAYEHISPVEIQRMSGLPASLPLFDLLLLWGSATESRFVFDQVQFEQLTGRTETTATVLLAISKEQEQLNIVTVFDETKIDHVEIEAFLSGLNRILDTMCNQPDANLGMYFNQPAIAENNQVYYTPAWDSPDVSKAITTEEKLNAIWRKVLGLKYVGPDDNFFELGGSSLQASLLIIQIEKQLGKVLPLSTLLSAGSIRDLLLALDEPVKANKAMVTLQPFGQRPPFYIVPGIGGNVLGLKSLANALGDEQPVIGFQSIGLDGTQEPFNNIEEIAAHNLTSFPQTNQPFVLFGVCWGAIVAYEMAQQLSAAGKAVPLLIMMDPTAHEESRAVTKPPGLRKSKLKFVTRRLRLYASELKSLRGKELRNWLMQKVSLAKVIVKNRELLNGDSTEFNQNRVTEANMHAMLNYQAKPYSGKTLLLFTANRDIAPDMDTRKKWFDLLSHYDVNYIAGKDTGDAMSAQNVQNLAQHFNNLDAEQIVEYTTSDFTTYNGVEPDR